MGSGQKYVDVVTNATKAGMLVAMWLKRVVSVVVVGVTMAMVAAVISADIVKVVTVVWSIVVVVVALSLVAIIALAVALRPRRCSTRASDKL